MASLYITSYNELKAHNSLLYLPSCAAGPAIFVTHRSATFLRCTRACTHTRHHEAGLVCVLCEDQVHSGLV